jgi:RNA polymerase sigma-70 factor (ECF subfamily)
LPGLGTPAKGAKPSEAALKPLVEAARRGDRRAFEQLVRLTWAATYTLAYRLTGNPEDALDVTQESYLRALKGLPRFRGEARFSTWLYRVTANCASNHRQRSSRARHDHLDMDALEVASPRYNGTGNPEAAATTVDDRVLLEEALLRLPLRLRQVVVLRDVYDLSHKAIAAELGTSEAAAKMGIQRARQRLRDDLTKQMAEVAGGSAGGRRAVLRRRAKRADGTLVPVAPVVDRDDDVDRQADAVAS